MIRITKEKDCCGCGACQATCPTAAITMQPATLGARIPVVDAGKCVDCGMCEQVCPMGHSDGAHAAGDAYAAYAKDADVRYGGSSGGMFGTFASYLLEDGYAVYGAAFDEDLQLRCTRAETAEQLAPLMKSKYLQSDLSDKYAEIRERLQNGQRVMFVSAPCQVAALKRYLDKEYEGLLTVDFFCHGVPSQAFFDACVRLFEQQFGVKVTQFSFRSKLRHGATPHYYTIAYDKEGIQKQETKLYFDFPFYAAFQKYITLRESCYDCRFASAQRYADITIGDFHDIDRYVSGINRFDGVSTVILNTEKGRRLWECCADRLAVYPVDLHRLVEDEVCFAGGTARPAGRDAFVQDYEQMPFAAFVDKHLNSKHYWKQRVYYHLPHWLRGVLKKVMKV